MAIVIGLLGLVALIVLGSVWKGFVLSIMWGWFVVPFGAPALSIPWAIGLSSLVGLTTYQYNANDEKKDEDAMAKAIGVTLGLPAIALLIGYIVHSFM